MISELTFEERYTLPPIEIVSGDPAEPEQATEVWTFARHVGGAPGDWKLSAIQQA